MKKLTGMFLSLLLTACSTSHEVKIDSQPCLYPYRGFDFILCNDFRFMVNNTSFDIPRGFTTDLASVPRALWSIYAPNRTETIAGAVIHDYLYFCPSAMTRKEADSIFYDSLILQGIPKTTAFKYWAAVRIFGTTHFKEGAICTHANTGTKNSAGHLRMADTTIPKGI
jgi:hypothetical protein